MRLEKRLGVTYYLTESGEMAALYFWEYYDKDLKMVVYCDLGRA